MATESAAGRKRDPARDGVILASTLAVLAEHGYEGMTIDLVAAHAGMARATVYRRWPTPAELVLDAVSRLSQDDVGLDRLPDTGTLRGDLLAMIKPFDDEQELIRIQAVVGLLTMAKLDQRLAAAAGESGIGPWVEAHRKLIERAVDRGEFAAPADIDTLAEVLPMQFLARVAQRKSMDREHSIALIDGVLIPALRGSSPVTTGSVNTKE